MYFLLLSFIQIVKIYIVKQLFGKQSAHNHFYIGVDPRQQLGPSYRFFLTSNAEFLHRVSKGEPVKIGLYLKRSSLAPGAEEGISKAYLAKAYAGDATEKALAEEGDEEEEEEDVADEEGEKSAAGLEGSAQQGVGQKWTSVPVGEEQKPKRVLRGPLRAHTVTSENQHRALREAILREKHEGRVPLQLINKRGCPPLFSFVPAHEPLETSLLQMSEDLAEVGEYLSRGVRQDSVNALSGSTGCISSLKLGVPFSQNTYFKETLRLGNFLTLLGNAEATFDASQKLLKIEEDLAKSNKEGGEGSSSGSASSWQYRKDRAQGKRRNGFGKEGGESEFATTPRKSSGGSVGSSALSSGERQVEYEGKSDGDRDDDNNVDDDDDDDDESTDVSDIEQTMDPDYTSDVETDTTADDADEGVR